MEGFLVIFIFIGVIALTALVFGVWIVVTLVRLVFRGFTAVLAPHELPPMPSTINGSVCRNDVCRANNPGTARFCRRCGKPLPEAQRVAVRRAAMW